MLVLKYAIGIVLRLLTVGAVDADRVELGNVHAMECEERGRDYVESRGAPRHSEDLFVARKCAEDPTAFAAVECGPASKRSKSNA